MSTSVKFLLSICCGLFLNLPSGGAQIPKHSVKLGYAVASIQAIDFDFGSSQSSSTQEKDKVVGPLNFSYAYTLRKRVQLGVAVTLVEQRTTYTYTGSSNMRVDRANSRAIMPLVGFVWMRSENSSVYSNYMVGVDFWKETRNTTGLPVREKKETREAYQLNLIGVTYGKRLKGFAEFGVGIAGVVNVGICLDL